jgi:hypothetical protein
MNKQTIIETLINDGGSAKFAQMTAEVEQKQLKTGNPLRNAKVTKIVEYNMLLNANYQNMVNNRREKEGKEADFEAKENWFKKVNDGFNGSIVANKKDETALYLFFACNNAKTHKYLVNGIEATPDEIAIIKQFKPEVKKAENQGLEEDVVVRTVKLSGIKQIKCGAEISFAE